MSVKNYLEMMKALTTNTNKKVSAVKAHSKDVVISNTMRTHTLDDRGRKVFIGFNNTPFTMFPFNHTVPSTNWDSTSRIVMEHTAKLAMNKMLYSLAKPYASGDTYIVKIMDGIGEPMLLHDDVEAEVVLFTTDWIKNKLLE